MTTTLAHFEHSTGHHICLTQKSVLKLESILQIGREQLELLLSKNLWFMLRGHKTAGHSYSLE